jgi:hypothetical protein
MLRPLHALCALSLAAAPLTAQVPFDQLLVLEGPPGSSAPVFRFVDTLPGGGVTELRDQRVFTSMRGLAVDPADAGQAYFSSDASSLAGIWRIDLEHETFVRGQWGSWARTGVGALAVGATEIVYADLGGGLAAVPKAGGVPRTLIQGLAFVDVAVDGRIAFALEPSGALTRFDLSLAAVSGVGSYPAARCVAVRDAVSLLIGTDAGEILTVDRSSGAVLGRLAPNKGAVLAVAQTSFGFPAFATAREVWSLLDLTTPLHVAAGSILDLDIGREDRAAVLRFGAGCGAAGRTPAQQVEGRPSLGDPGFAAVADGGPPGLPVVLQIGPSRAFSALLGIPLPLDLAGLGLPGCSLLTEPLISAGASFDARGRARVGLPIPNQAGLRGLRLYAQWIGVDPLSPVQAVLSDGVAWRLR